ncbi:GapA-binding peptide SR1P [Domibacillus sp. DTU_2020_1001157_1_SI_ALB_TIR_016]
MEGGNKLGTLICYTCNATIGHFEDEKVTFLYSNCECENCSQNNEDNE